jgi:succinoglycan biosynthesis transport protein ExoP
MDDTNNLAPRERPAGGPGDSLQNRSPFLALDLMPREPHLLDYLILLRKHQWLILFFLLAIVSIVSIATIRMQPIYEATARVEIDRENTNAIHFADSDAEDMYADLEDYITTQSKILQSETLAMLTVRSMGLDNLPEFGGNPAKPVRPAAPGSEASLHRPPALGAFLGRMTIKRVPSSRLLDVTFESTDPSLAARVVNAHLNNFIEQNFRSRYEAATQASNWLAGQLNEMKIKVENAEDARLAYERQNQIWTIDEKNDISSQKLADLNRQLTEAQADRINKEAVYQLAQAGNYDAISAVRESVVIQDILKQESALSAQYTDAVNQYGPKYPKVLRLQAQLKDLDQLVAREKTNIGNQMEAEYHGSRQRELLLKDALDEQKAETNQMAEKLVQYNILKREADTNKQLYDGMLQKLKEAGITAGLRSSNIRIVDPALIPGGPSRPNKTRNVMLSILVGLIGGIGLALLREYLDNTVKTPDDIETLARLPSLAVVPALSNSNGKGNGRFAKLLKAPVIAGREGRAELVSHNMPQSQMSEAFRALRTSLLLSQADHPPQVILMTSALPREGKTTAAVNLAVTLAQLGDKTLLVDADLRKPGINRALSLVDGKHAGLSSYLAGVSTLDLITVPHPAITNLAAIPTGPIPPNPADLLSSHKLTELIAELRTRYKFVVIDSPPIMAATDAVILSVLVDGVLLVVRSGETPKEAFTRTRDLLAGVKCRMLGVVLNAVDASSPDYYYSYRYYPYSYGSYGTYGRDEESKKSRRSRRAENSDSQLGQD